MWINRICFFTAAFLIESAAAMLGGPFALILWAVIIWICYVLAWWHGLL